MTESGEILHIIVRWCNCDNFLLNNLPWQRQQSANRWVFLLANSNVQSALTFVKTWCRVLNVTTSCAKEHVANFKECLICKETPFRAKVETALKRVMKKLPYPCKYCSSPIPKGKLDVHEANCQKRPRHCGVTYCEFESGGRADALRHLIYSHGTDIWNRYTEATAAGMCVGNWHFI